MDDSYKPISGSRVDQKRVQDAVRELLTAIGEDPERPGLVDTPARVGRFWAEFIDYAPGTVTTSFAEPRADQMVTVSGMQVWSLCEHHMLPYYAVVDAAYISMGKILGLSKFARIAHKHAHKLQVQERMTDQIADELMQVTGSTSVAVRVQGVHLCMLMRGIKTPATMTTTAMRGAFYESVQTRAEFFSNVESNHGPTPWSN